MILAAAEATTRHGKLLRVDPTPIQNWVVLDFVYDTGNAAGQNMVTLATEAACQLIRERTGFPYFLESGFNSDKKPSRRNLMVGPGPLGHRRVLAPRPRPRLPGRDARSVLEFQRLAVTSSQAIGMLGHNLHLANALTALYLATGQDTACVAENAVGFSEAICQPGTEGMTFRVTLPSLTVGTVGGGTRLPVQRRNLALLGCDEGRYASRKLAEIIAAARRPHSSSRSWPPSSPAPSPRRIASTAGATKPAAMAGPTATPRPRRFPPRSTTFRPPSKELCDPAI